MAILSGVGKLHLNGKKDLTNKSELLVLDAVETIYVPLVIGASTAFDVHVEEGQEVCVGTLLATRTDMVVPVYSPVSGIYKGIEKRMHVSGRPQNHLVIENDFKNTVSDPFTFDHVDEMDASSLTEAIKTMGIVGLGGSGFPTYIKYQGVKDIQTILINAVECEPYITSDYKMIKTDVDALFDGSRLLAKAANATQVIIATKKGKPEFNDMLAKQAEQYDNVKMAFVTDAYPLGWERTLIREVLKKEYDKLPSEIGVIVNNATTAMAVSVGLRKHTPLTHRIVTMSGEGLAKPTNVLVPVGTPVNYIVEKMGGYAADVEEGIVIHGGPMMGKSVMNDTFVITSYTNAVTVLPKEQLEELPCLKCGLCTEHCPAKIQPVQIMNAEKMADVDRMVKLATQKCVECGLCSYVCPSKIEVSDWVAKAKRRLALAKR